MQPPYELIEELEVVQKLLLVSDRESMRQCEIRLTDAVDKIRNQKGTLPDAPRLKQSLGNIRKLLDNARRFWEAYQSRSDPGVEYNPRGICLNGEDRSIFACEG